MRAAVVKMDGDAPSDVESTNAGIRRKSEFEGAGIRRMIGASGSPLFVQFRWEPLTKEQCA